MGIESDRALNDLSEFRAMVVTITPHHLAPRTAAFPLAVAVSQNVTFDFPQYRVQDWSADVSSLRAAITGLPFIPRVSREGSEHGRSRRRPRVEAG